MRQLAFFFLTAMTAFATMAQDDKLPVADEIHDSSDNKVTASLGVDLVNQYVWRGLYLGGVGVQPTLGIEYRGLSLSAWGNIGVSDPEVNKEIDLTLEYEYKGFNVSVTDYWLSEGNFFNWKNSTTPHVFGASVGYDFGFLAAAWYTNFAGADGTKSDGSRAYSSYFELSAPFKLGGLDWTGSIGFTPWETTYYEASGFAVTEIALKAVKEFTIKDRFRIPIFGKLSANPCAEKLYFIFGAGFYI